MKPKEQPIRIKKAQGEATPSEAAMRVLHRAAELGIPITHSGDLAEILSRLDLSDEIEAETYVIVAEILAFAFRADLDWRRLAGASETS